MHELVSPERWDLDAPYQRGHVWTIEQQRELIRSILAGVPIGSITFATIPVDEAIAEGHDHSYRVVDGKQRLTALHAFVSGTLDVPADWFPDDHLDPVSIDVREDGDGRRSGWVNYSSLSKLGQRLFVQRPTSTLEFDSCTEKHYVEPGTGAHGNRRHINIRQRTKTEALAAEAAVFDAINFAGTPQTDADRDRARPVPTRRSRLGSAFALRGVSTAFCDRCVVVGGDRRQDLTG